MGLYGHMKLARRLQDVDGANERRTREALNGSSGRTLAQATLAAQDFWEGWDTAGGAPKRAGFPGSVPTQQSCFAPKACRSLASFRPT